MDDEEQKNNICTPSTCIESSPPEPVLLEGIAGFVLPIAIICAMLILLSKIERIRELVYQALKKLEK
jgi:hypothetical protein